MDIGKLGVWCSVDHLPSPEAAAFAQRLEGWGYGALWIPEAVGRNAYVSAAWLLANTRKLVVATGIANMYARDAQASHAAQMGLAEQSGGRFLLTLGVSHVPLVEGLRGGQYGKPVSSMRAYLAAMGKSLFMAAPPAQKPPTLIAALRPGMLELAKTDADGAHPYNVTPEHTARAREILGPGKWLCVEQKILAETDPVRARAIARDEMKFYLALPNYQECWRWLGFEDADWANGGSDRLIDAMVAWGDDAAIRARLQAHWDAGADHVCIHALGQQTNVPDEALLERLAPCV